MKLSFRWTQLETKLKTDFPSDYWERYVEVWRSWQRAGKVVYANNMDELAILALPLIENIMNGHATMIDPDFDLNEIHAAQELVDR